MFFKKGKRGQIYIIAAVIIILILVGFVGVSNKVSQDRRPTKFYDLGTNFELEGYSLYDYAKYNSKDVNTTINQFTKLFSEYIELTGENAEFAILRGSSKGATWTTYTKKTGGTAGGGGVGLPLGDSYDIKVTEISSIVGGVVQVEFKGEMYKFQLSNNEEFIFIFVKSEGFNSWINMNKQTKP